MNFKLEHCGDYIEIRNFKHFSEDAINGNPYNTSFHLFVKSNLFQGFGDCEIDIKDFKKFACEIIDMYAFKKNKAILKDICYGSFVELQINGLGQIEVSGKVYADSARHNLEFHFMADQTSLKPFAEDLKIICKEEKK